MFCGGIHFARLLLTLLIELFLLLMFNGNLVFQFCYRNNLVLVLTCFYNLSNEGLECRCSDIVTTFWHCNCNIAATFISFSVPLSTRSIFESISVLFLCTSVMVFILYVLIVWLSYFFKYIDPLPHNVSLGVMHIYTNLQFITGFIWISIPF